MTIEGSIVPLPWDSEFFGRRIGALECGPSRPSLTPEDLAGFDLVQAKVPSSRLDLADDLDRLGFRLAEGEVSYAYQVPPDSGQAGYVVAGRQDLQAVQDLARHAFRFSRYRHPWFGAEDAGSLYATWAAKAIDGTFDDQCLVLEKDSGGLGFVTLRATGERTARIGLLVAGPLNPPKNAGARLVDAALGWCAARGIERLHVATQLSHGSAMRLYARTGGVVESTAYWMYWSPDVS